MGVLVWIFLDQICPKWIKSVQNGSNLIKFNFSAIKNVIVKRFVGDFFSGHFIFIYKIARLGEKFDNNSVF